MTRVAFGFLRGWSREPLVHFLAAGFVLFVVTEGRREQTDTQRIVITPQREAQLASRYALQFGVAPDAAMLTQLVERDVQDEILFRSGRALRLDQDDEIVRRRIVQKMEFLLEDLRTPKEPTEAELEAYYAAHAARYRAPARVTFAHVYFAAAPDDAAGRARAERVLQRSSSAVSTISPEGDPFPDLSHFTGYEREQVHRVFGRSEFAVAVFAEPLGRWSGPFRSAYGWHLIRVEARREARQQELSAVRDRVRADLLFDEQARVNRAAFNELASEYEVVRTKS